MPTRAGPPTVEHHRQAIGIGDANPRLSWKTEAGPGWRQAAYELEVRTATATYSTGRLGSSASVLVPWPGEALVSRQMASVRVRVWGSEDDAPSPWGPWAPVEAGLLRPEDWKARPVGPGWPEDPGSDQRRAPLVRRAFNLDAPVQRARLYVSAHGLYEVEVNGARVGAEAMAPGWTSYRHRLRYATYDITGHLSTGENVVGAWLGDGWYRGRLGWYGGFRNIYGADIGLIAQVEVELTDGRRVLVATDERWKAHPGPIMHTGNYDGEYYDARAELPGWSAPGFDDREWGPVAVGRRDPATLVAPDGPPVRCTDELLPRSVITTPSGKVVLDFGQNLVGRLRMRVTGRAGETVTFRTAEVLQESEIYTRPLRSALSTDTYVIAGRAVEEWEPRFTIHGFRYVEVSGWPGDVGAAIDRGDIVARVYHTDMERTGWFECSEALVNQLHDNVVWSMRGNFVDIPTDCPQRDERVGWTGDAQVFAPTATFLYDCAGLLTSWLKDLAVEQMEDGTVPWYVPFIPAHKTWSPLRPGAVWGDAAVLVPWAVYERFGDAAVLDRQFASAKAWVDLVTTLAGPDRLWDDGFQLGDWLDPTAPPQDPANGATNRYLVATAYFAWSASVLARQARALGRGTEAEGYERLADEVRAAFARRYLDGQGRLTSPTQTAYALAVHFGLLAPGTEVGAALDLARLVDEAGARIATGFAGTPVICDALTEVGQTAQAYKLLLQRECPSWLYPVLQGATTIWERWDALLPDGTVNPGTMTSFNHYAFGSVADWLHRVVAGLAPAAPGYREILFRPRPGGGLTWAKARHETPYGTAEISWRRDGDRIELSLLVPTGTSAVLDLANEPPRALAPGRHKVTGAWPAAADDGPPARAASGGVPARGREQVP